LGVRLEGRTFPADTSGYEQLALWAETLGRLDAFGVEGTGSYGAGLTSLLRRRGHRVVEVNRGNRQARRNAGKSDPADAEVAARQVLAGVATAVPKTADGQVEILRQVKVARDTAVKARTSAIITLKQIVVNAPAALREQLGVLGDKALIARCAGFRVGQVTDTTTAAKYTLRVLARRWQALNAEIVDADHILDRVTTATAPTLRQAFGIGPDTAAEMLIVFGDNPERVHSEAAFAKLCGACPIPAGSGMTDGRHRLYRGGHRQANAALYRSAIVRMRFHQPTIDYVKRRTTEGLGKREIIRCVKRYLAREIYQHVMTDHRARHTPQPAT
jgi:transposase